VESFVQGSSHNVERGPTRVAVTVIVGIKAGGDVRPSRLVLGLAAS